MDLGALHSTIGEHARPTFGDTCLRRGYRTWGFGAELTSRGSDEVRNGFKACFTVTAEPFDGLGGEVCVEQP